MSAILLLSCPDTRGIVAEVSWFINEYGGNIVDSIQHHDSDTGTFFMRVEWDTIGFDLPNDKIEQSLLPIAERFGMDWRLYFSDRAPRVAIFVSRYTHCLHDLLLRYREGDLPMEIVLVASNHQDAESIVNWAEVPFYHFPIDKQNKAEIEGRQIDLLKREKIELIVLARYMQILTERFVMTFPNRIINIHHSFLPAFVGSRPYHQAFDRGVKIIGATSHYVTPDLDQGPIIAQDVDRITHRDAVSDIIRKGRDLERVVLDRAVRLYLERRVLVFGNKTIVFE